ncbi:hypothetical protein P43SY_007179 [Pythium insidiosum]|uniref:RRM domain-containing protein n=1 Tax=Pythium insidiosum TaxID=114742 RepID=A0AAD5M2S8_PYTIN|nr:hypothetical protein P43SY_007179 [Pythium insidiosum]
MAPATANKRNLYVGGLDRQVTEEILYAAFIPFGPLKQVQIPTDLKTRQPKGFGFVEYEEEEDAHSELFGKTLRVTIAKPERPKLGANKPEAIAVQFALIPSAAQELLVRALRDARLRRLERLLSGYSSPRRSEVCSPREPAPLSMEPEWEDLFQAEWHARCSAKSLPITPKYSSSSETVFRDALPPRRDARQLYWEHAFRMQLRRDGQPAKEWPPRQPDLSLFSDVVKTVRAQARELVPRTSHWISQLPLLHRLEVHHPMDHQSPVAYWSSLETVITMAPTLTELCFFHGRLSGPLLTNLAKALQYRHECKSLRNRPIRTLELLLLLPLALMFCDLKFSPPRYKRFNTGV